jgi:hypothetical protein
MGRHALGQERPGVSSGGPVTDLTRRRFLGLLGIAPVAAQIRLEAVPTPVKQKQRIRRIRRTNPDHKRMQGPWDTHSVTPDDTTLLLFNNDPVPAGYRVVSDRWI